MMRRGTIWAAGLLVCGLAGGADGPLRAETVLLAPSRGQLPQDVGSDDRSKLALVDHPQLGGKALRVTGLPGDSFGSGAPAVRDWSRFGSLRFTVFHPGQKPLQLSLTIVHQGSVDYPTRVDVPFAVRPGLNRVEFHIAGLRNVNGTVPQLNQVRRWYIACAEDQQAEVLFFGDFVLTPGQGSAPSATSAAPAGQGYQITGRVGQFPVDLVVRPLAKGERPADAKPRRLKRVPVRYDPARVERIRRTKMPPVRRVVMFHTPEADRIVSALEVFPPDHPINQTVEHWPVHPNSQAIIRSIGSDKPLRYNPDMAYVIVPPNQPRVPVRITLYADESDPGPFPVPENVPLEGWPQGFRQFHPELRMTLDALQRDTHNLGGDRHALVLDPVNRMLYEFYQMKRTDRGWQASSAAVFDLKTNRLRPQGWTSADAAGLPIFPLVVRYDELKRGMVEHAMRVTVRRTRRAYVAPATHFASRLDDPNLPRMGERLRLKRDFDISGFSPEVQAILKGLKKYGMIVADNGLDWAISVAPDPRIPDMHAQLRRIPGSAFEVVVAPWDAEVLGP